MVIPLMKQAADGQGTDGHSGLRYSTVWAHTAARAVDARRALRALLAHAPRTGRKPVPAHLAVDAELAVSELVTNAIRHAPGPCGLILQLSCEALAITVWDTSTEEPRVKTGDRHRVGGHGLHLVHAVSGRVVVAPYAGGKQITAYLNLGPQREHHHRWEQDRSARFPLRQNRADATI
ncbi:anti-sigma regulatory factor (Ser/Thr protein kinase) [Streptomyces sp. LBL]|uniref:ATP-binding protein n=1 Tax=Streptomyces sp. LBL TaxID=2940562 RepID=UPI002473A113|nr:ATP-binding protein [Streptomyces sp. LBL]MDH6622562.1 anti-sigma regulatory factor (Ser/Thr protein kinase) [Streptomyces sp. LBL]